MALIDDITITIKAGTGGAGGRSFHTNYGSVDRHPDGGNGGRGGDIYFEGTTNLNGLNEFRFKKKISAPDGERGMNKNLDGKKGEDITILVPLGTSIINTANGETVEILEEKVPVLLAKGGRGLAGNHDQRISTNPRNHFDAEKAQLGEEKELHLILSMIADIGLIGLPNAGKSSLLKTLTAALPKIGDYPFTTLEPNLGVMQVARRSSLIEDEIKKEEHETDEGSEMLQAKTDKPLVLADIPGLVEGASAGRGLGVKFLKHIQKTKVLLHCIDATGSDAYETYLTVRKEFEDYDPTLLEKKEVILLTKTDLVDEETLNKRKKELKKTKREILTTSIYNPDSIAALKSELTKLI